MIAYRIIMLRKRMGISQTQLAKKLHISASAEGNYEQGRRLPSVDMLLMMSEIFDVSLDYLVTGEEHVSSHSQPAPAPRKDCPCTTCYWKTYNDP